MNFKVKQKIRKYMNVGDEWQYVETYVVYDCGTLANANDLICTLMKYSTSEIDLSIIKEEVTE